MRASIMRDVQCEHRERSMDGSDGPEKKISLWHDTPPAFGREHAALSVTDGCRRWGGERAKWMRLARSVPALRGDRPSLTSPRPDAPRRKTRDLAPVTMKERPLTEALNASLLLHHKRES
jgi:hypothetical protein